MSIARWKRWFFGRLFATHPVNKLKLYQPWSSAKQFENKTNQNVHWICVPLNMGIWWDSWRLNKSNEKVSRWNMFHNLHIETKQTNKTAGGNNNSDSAYSEHDMILMELVAFRSLSFQNGCILKDTTKITHTYTWWKENMQSSSFNKLAWFQSLRTNTWVLCK